MTDPPHKPKSAVLPKMIVKGVGFVRDYDPELDGPRETPEPKPQKD